MKRMGLVLATLVGLMLAVDTAEAAGLFSRFRLFNRTPVRTTTATRAEGHTETTGTGTAVDGKPKTHAAPKQPTKAVERNEGHTETTGKGTKVDGK
jgi:hypothetical protein